MPQLKKTDAQRALGNVIRADVKKAAGGNDLVSRTEQKKLGSFLQDVAQEMRKRGGSGSRVEADALIDKAMNKAMSIWNKHTGGSARDKATLSQDELAKIAKANPELAELTSRALGKKPSTGGGGVVGAAVFEKLPAGAMKEAVATLRQEWLDNNIMNDNGVVLSGGIAKGKPEAMQALASKLLVAEAGDDGWRTTKAEAKATAPQKLTTKLLDEAVLTIGGRGFVYDTSNKDNLKQVAGELAPLLKMLGDRKDIDLVKATGAHPPEGRDDFPPDLHLYLFANRTNGRSLSIFVSGSDG